MPPPLPPPLPPLTTAIPPLPTFPQVRVHSIEADKAVLIDLYENAPPEDLEGIIHSERIKRVPSFIPKFRGLINLLNQSLEMKHSIMRTALTQTMLSTLEPDIEVVN